ncbi:MAG: ATP-dependent RecD-like DNA helicase [Clostridia bacterium]|nr:ATP-dependent RecD-like DNA helicase [Clostridia bacterium]
MAERMSDDHGIIELKGSVEGIIYANEENGYTICDLGTEEGELVTVVGVLPYISEGDSLAVYGRWVHNPKYGRQFAAERFEKSLPADKASMLRYLASRAIKGIGPKTAQKIIDMFGDETFDVIENHPEWLADIPGISRKKAEEISEDFREKAGMRSAMIFFRDFFGAATTVKIFNKWGSRSVDIAKKNPYRLCDEIEGIGFERADSMAIKLGMGEGSRERVLSGVVYLLSRTERQNGHTCLPREKLAAASAELLGVSVEQTEEAISELLRTDRLRYSLWDGVKYIYRAETYEDESFIAERLVYLDSVCASVNVEDIGRLIVKTETESGITYAALQRSAIADALVSGVTVLTGGPGTGKTTVVRALIGIFENMGFEVALAAPTGRAAKRLSESTSREAKTIHRLLEMGYGADDGNARFMRDRDNLLEEDVIIVDEASMIDNGLMRALVEAIKPGARFIIIGDADQLPSVGAGNVLRDIIESGRFSTVRLTEIFRQAQQSLIVTNAHKINGGEMPDLTVKNSDFFFLPRSTDREIAETVADLYANRLPRAYGAECRHGIQVISPSRRGEAGSETLNIRLQAVLNPPKDGKREHKYREITYREGDRVMQIRNNYELEWHRGRQNGAGIFNGDIGVISHIGKSSMTIVFDDRGVEYDFSLLEDLEPAYAITVHKSQGSEYPTVIIPAYSAPPMLLTRNLLYTAVTRAQTRVIIVGKTEIVETMVNNNRQSLRYTGLARRLKKKELEV